MATNNLRDLVVTNPIGNQTVSINAADSVFNLTNYFDDPLTTGRVAHFNLANTSIGAIANGVINVVLFDQTGGGAPLTVQNFQNYVGAGSYTNSFIHRSIPNFIIQGGGFTYNNETLATIPTNAPVQNEFSASRSNLRGTIAMAKLGSDPNSATDQWFFNLADNSTNLNNQNGGFTVFGQALGASDLATIDAIAAVKTYQANTTTFTNLPLTQPAISDTNFIRFSSITVTQEKELTFAIVGNTKPTLVSPSISNNQLILDYLPNQTGNSDITVRATNLFGESIDYMFTTTVLPSITLAIAPASVTEDGAANLVYTLTRNGDLSSPLIANYSVAGTATFGTDYTQSGATTFTATTGTVTFAAGASTATVTIDPTADTTGEPDESVSLTLASGTGYTVGTTTAVVGTILNDDVFINEGGSIVVTNNFLKATGINTANAQSLYTLKSLPVNGVLQLNGVNLAVNGTFKQDDINNSRVTYIHNGSETISDSFNFDVSDGSTIITRISTAADGTQGDFNSYYPAISSDGRYVTFTSGASNLVSGDTNGIDDVFIKDLSTNSITRVSTAADGTQANNNGSYYYSAISGNGRYVVFYSDASNLVSGDTNVPWDIFIKDLSTNSIARVSTPSDGTQGNSFPDKPAISSDGRYVVFDYGGSNLVSGDTNNSSDIFIKDLSTNSITRISTALDGTQGNRNSSSPAISADGRYVVFASGASNLVSGDTNNTEDIFVKDLTTNSITRISTALDGTQANNFSYQPSISADGRYVVFSSPASNLVSGDTNGETDIFIKDLTTNSITHVSTAADGTRGNNESNNAAISADGRYVVFDSVASNLVSGDTNGTRDVFIKDLITNSIIRISSQASSASYNPSISADGRYVAFWSEASNLVSGDSNNRSDVFLYAPKLVNVTTNIAINPVNDAPIITPTIANLSYTENATIAIDSNITITDADSTNLTSATISITTGFTVGQDLLNFTNQNGITGTYNSSTGVLSLIGSSTVANYQTALRSITYTNNSDSPNTTARTIGFSVNDGTDSSIQRTRNVTITAVNDAPIVSNAILDQNAIQGTAFNFVIPPNSFSDPDASDILTYSATRSDNTALPTWLTFNPTTRTFSGSPTSGDIGALNVKVTATDTANAAVNDIFAINVTAKPTWNLDIDGDGKVGALSDGIIAVRYLFGSAFSGNALINGAISPTATRNLSQIQAYLQEGVTNKYLDIDGNGSVGALSDGIMAVRYMFGSAFSGNALIAGAIAPDATRNLAGIQSYLAGLTTLT